jgi:hypothetical protein
MLMARPCKAIQAAAWIAAEGVAGRRSAKIASVPLNQSREALLAGRPLYSSEGGINLPGSVELPCPLSGLGLVAEQVAGLAVEDLADGGQGGEADGAGPTGSPETLAVIGWS